MHISEEVIPGTASRFQARIAKTVAFPADSSRRSGSKATHTTLATSSPQFAHIAAVYDWIGAMTPVVGDVDGDGRNEVAVLHGGSPPKLRVFGDDGVERWTAPLGVDSMAGGNLGIPAIGDVDNDGRAEIAVVLTNFVATSLEPNLLYLFYGDGTLVTGFPVSLPRDDVPVVMMADLDGDKYKEIVVMNSVGDQYTGRRQMTIVSRTAQIVAQWGLPDRTFMGAGYNPIPSAGNFDDDPLLEIVVAEPANVAGYDWDAQQWNSIGVVHVFNLDGSEVPGWPKYLPSYTLGSTAIADLDGDGRDDIVFSSMYDGNTPYGYEPNLGGVHAFDRAGNYLPGWPKLLGEVFWSTPAIGDLNGDGRLDVAFTGYGKTWVLRADGETLPGWPQSIVWSGMQSASLADVNSDGAPDVVATSGSGHLGGGVYAWNATGELLKGFPLYTEADAQAGAVVSDIDRDGKVEFISSSSWDFNFVTQTSKYRGSLYVWDVEARHRPNIAYWPQTNHDGGLSSRLRIPLDLAQFSVDTPSAMLRPGNSLLITDTVKNTSKLVVRDSTTRYYISSDPVRSLDDRLLKGERAIPSLAQMALSTGTVTVQVPADIAPGKFYLLVCADDTALVSEENETNNCRASEIKVGVAIR